jgi:hypothetical protein
MAITPYYVDSDIGGTSGAGTEGNPFSAIQHAYDTVTRDATNGDLFYGKGSETLAAALDRTAYGTPTETAPLVHALWDGNPWTLTAANATTAIEPFTNFSSFIGVTFDCAAATVRSISAGALSLYLNCVFRNSAYNNTNSMMLCNTAASVYGCHFYNAFYAVRTNAGLIQGCHFEDCESRAISALDGNTRIIGNTFSLVDHAAAMAIATSNSSIQALNNSILAAAGTSALIDVNSTSGGTVIANNLLDGASGTGGIDIQVAGPGAAVFGNASYNCATNYSITNGAYELDNEVLGSSPFAKSGANTFANRGPYFAPLNVGNVWGSV